MIIRTSSFLPAFFVAIGALASSSHLLAQEGSSPYAPVSKLPARTETLIVAEQTLPSFLIPPLVRSYARADQHAIELLYQRIFTPESQGCSSQQAQLLTTLANNLVSDARQVGDSIELALPDAQGSMRFQKSAQPSGLGTEAMTTIDGLTAEDLAFVLRVSASANTPQCQPRQASYRAMLQDTDANGVQLPPDQTIRPRDNNVVLRLRGSAPANWKQLMNFRVFKPGIEVTYLEDRHLPSQWTDEMYHELLGQGWKPCGSGPYLLAGQHVETGAILFQANPSFRRRTAVSSPSENPFSSTTVQIPYVALVCREYGQASKSLFGDGSIDVMPELHLEDVLKARKDPKVTEIVLARKRFQFVAFDYRDPIFRSKSFRQALIYSVDPTDLCSQILDPTMAVPGGPILATDLAQEDSPGFRPVVRDLDKARSLMKLAKDELARENIKIHFDEKTGKWLRKKANKVVPFTLSFAYPQARGDEPDVVGKLVPEIKSQIEKLGLTVEPFYVTEPKWDSQIFGLPQPGTPSADRTEEQTLWQLCLAEHDMGSSLDCTALFSRNECRPGGANFMQFDCEGKTSVNEEIRNFESQGLSGAHELGFVKRLQYSLQPETVPGQPAGQEVDGNAVAIFLFRLKTFVGVRHHVQLPTSNREDLLDRIEDWQLTSKGR